VPSCRRPSLAVLASVALLAGVGVPASSAAAESAPQKALRSVVTIVAGTSQGTGFAYGGQRRLVTNAHVVGSARTVEVMTDNGRRFKGTVAAIDRRADLAVIRISESIPPLPGRGAPPAQGEDVFAIGSPLGLTGSVAKGIVSAVRKHGGTTAIQTDVSVNPGNSGGPLIDLQGRVLGVNTSRLQGGEGIAFAVPISQAETLIRRGETAGPAASETTGPWTLIGVGAGLLAALVLLFLVLWRRSRRQDDLGIRLHRRRRRGRRRAPNPVVQWEPDERVALRRSDNYTKEG
jgi:S1-C subfamily serine protease